MKFDDFFGETTTDIVLVPRERDSLRSLFLIKFRVSLAAERENAATVAHAVKLCPAVLCYFNFIINIGSILEAMYVCIRVYVYTLFSEGPLPSLMGKMRRFGKPLFPGWSRYYPMDWLFLTHTVRLMSSSAVN